MTWLWTTLQISLCLLPLLATFSRYTSSLPEVLCLPCIPLAAPSWLCMASYYSLDLSLNVPSSWKTTLIPRQGDTSPAYVPQHPVLPHGSTRYTVVQSVPFCVSFTAVYSIKVRITPIFSFLGPQHSRVLNV